MNPEDELKSNYRVWVALSMIEKNKKILSIGDINSSPITQIMSKNLGGNIFTIDVRNGADKKTDLEKEQLPFEDNSFDYIFAGEVFEHIFNLRNLLKDIHRVLKNSGYLVLTTPNSVSLLDRFRVILGRLPQNCALGDYLEEHGNLRDFNWKLAEEYLKESGFKIINKKTDGVIFRNKRILKYCPLSFGNTIIIKAEKVV